jgi:hypothetical protein
VARSSPSGSNGLLPRLVRPQVFAPLLVAMAMASSALLVDRGLPTNDEGGILAISARILRGEVFYRDLDSYHFPGATYLLAGWLAVFGETVNAARWLAAIVFSGVVLGLYATAVQLVDRQRAALFGLGLLAFKALALPAFTAFMYSDLALCFAAFALALHVGHEYRGPTRRLAGVGCLVALATATKQNVGIYLTAVIFVMIAFSPQLLGVGDRDLRRRAREIGVYTAGFCAVALPMLGYFAAQGLLPQLILSGLLRPLLQYLPTSGISFVEPLKWWDPGGLHGVAGFPFFVAPYWSMLMNEQLPGPSLYPFYWMVGELFSRALYTALPAVFLLAAWQWLRALPARSFDARDSPLFAFHALAGAVVFSAFPRADLYHLMSVYPVAFLMLFTLGSRRRRGKSARGEPTAKPWLATAGVSLLLTFALAVGVAHRAQQTYRFHVARADLLIDPSKAWVETVLDHLESTLDPGENFFVYGQEAHFYFYTGRHFPWPFPWIYPGQVGDAYGRPLARVLQKDPPRVVIRGVMSWPGVPGIPDYTPAVHRFVMSHYKADLDFFAEHPPKAGEPPPQWAVSILHLDRSRPPARILPKAGPGRRRKGL